MTSDYVKNVFFHRKPKLIGEYKKSAVMILIQEEQDELYIIFEVRSLKLRHQPGDICLPGGKIEERETPKEAAIRETCEELNITYEDIEYIGEMDYLVTPYGAIIYPFIAKLKISNLIPNKDEVDHIFKVPINFFLEYEPKYYAMDIGPISIEDFPFHLINNGKEYKFSKGVLNQYFYIYKNHVIWGFTARIIKAFTDILKYYNI